MPILPAVQRIRRGATLSQDRFKFQLFARAEGSKIPRFVFRVPHLDPAVGFFDIPLCEIMSRRRLCSALFRKH